MQTTEARADRHSPPPHTHTSAKSTVRLSAGAVVQYLPCQFDSKNSKHKFSTLLFFTSFVARREAYTNAASVYLDFSCQSHKFPSGKNNWVFSIYHKIEDTVKCQFHRSRGGEESGNLRAWKTEQRGKTVKSNLKPHWPEMRCNGSTVSRATSHIHICLHSTGPLQSLTQGKQTISFEFAAKKSHLSLPFTVRDVFRPSFSHSHRIQQQVGWGETQQKMTGDKLWGGKRLIFSPNQGLGKWTS